MAVAFAAIVVLVVCLARDRSPYAFLYRLPNWQFSEDMRHLGNMNLALDPEPHVIVLVFRNQNSAAILRELQVHLPQGSGYFITQDNSEVRDEVWEFSNKPLSGHGNILLRGSTAMFEHGMFAGIDVALHEGRPVSRADELHGPDGCIVVIPDQHNWFDDCLEGVRRFLHL